MSKTSIIIPSRNEKYLSKTVDDIFIKATGEIEVIIIIDGPTEYQLPKERKNLVFLNRKNPKGLRRAINDASDIATGKYLLKIDAHSMVSKGFDEMLKKDCEDDWVVTSRYYKLNAEKWEIDKEYGFSDYFFLSCPWNTERFILGEVVWLTRDKERKDFLIDDTMTMQGSLYFMAKEHFHKKIGYLDVERWGDGIMEAQEVVFKTWLGGGRVMVNKNVWNAHYHRPLEERHTLIPEFSKNRNVSIRRSFTRYILNNQWEGRVHDFVWLVEKFWPLPTLRNRDKRERHSWSENWRDLYSAYLNK